MTNETQVTKLDEDHVGIILPREEAEKLFRITTHCGNNVLYPLFKALFDAHIRFSDERYTGYINLRNEAGDGGSN